MPDYLGMGPGCTVLKAELTGEVQVVIAKGVETRREIGRVPALSHLANKHKHRSNCCSSEW